MLEEKNQKEMQELDLEDLEKVSGAGLRDVHITKTVDITKKVIKKINSPNVGAETDN